MSRLVCVSNRISLPRKSAAPGGLAIGILSAQKRTGGLVVRWGGELTVDGVSPETPRYTSETALLTRRSSSPNRGEFERYYNGFANEALWPLCHYPQRRATSGSAPRTSTHIRTSTGALHRDSCRCFVPWRRHLGARLPSRPARPAPARARRACADWLLPAHPLPPHRGVAGAARVWAELIRDLCQL